MDPHYHFYDKGKSGGLCKTQMHDQFPWDPNLLADVLRLELSLEKAFEAVRY